MVSLLDAVRSRFSHGNSIDPVFVRIDEDGTRVVINDT